MVCYSRIIARVYLHRNNNTVLHIIYILISSKYPIGRFTIVSSYLLSCNNTQTKTKSDGHVVEFSVGGQRPDPFETCKIT